MTIDKFQMNIHKVLILKPNKYLNHFEVWNKLWDIGVIGQKDYNQLSELKNTFMDAFLSLHSEYENIKLKIVNDTLFLGYFYEESLLESSPLKQVDSTCNIFVEQRKLVDVLANTGECLNDRIDSNGNTILHHLVSSDNTVLLSKYLTFNPELQIKNYEGKFPFDYATNNAKVILSTHTLNKNLQKVQKTSDELLIQVERMEIEIKQIKNVIQEHKNNLLNIKHQLQSKNTNYVNFGYIGCVVVGVVVYRWLF